MIERKAFLFSPVKSGISDEMSRREQLRANGDGLTSHPATGGAVSAQGSCVQL